MGIVESTYAELKQQELKNNPYSCLHMADIDINPHQIEAFTFALSSLELDGAILADEVGLGKTIEAGLVIKYLLCSGKNKILLIMPSNLRKQWQVELEEKFDIDSLIVDSSNWEDYLAKVKSKQAVIIVSYHFASKRKAEFGKIAWDFCVLDEAHRLRNVYKKHAIVRQKILDAVRKDLIGPTSDCEQLNEVPTSSYITGLLYPADTDVTEDENYNDVEFTEKNFDADGETLEAGIFEEEEPEDRVKGGFQKPSSIGVSFYVSDNVQKVNAYINWGKYYAEQVQGEVIDEEINATAIKSSFIPDYEIPSVSAQIDDMPEHAFSMLQMGSPKKKSEVIQNLRTLTEMYGSWITDALTNDEAMHDDKFKATGQTIIDKCNDANRRMNAGIDLIENNDKVYQAFVFMNQAMYLQRSITAFSKDYGNGIPCSLRDYMTDMPEKGRKKDHSEWRPFQIAFVLLNLYGIMDGESPERNIVDLLYFPTGGGKTEAYLGLIAFTIAYRRLTASDETDYEKDGGVTVFLRYTLRLLTTQQRDRLMRLIVAMEQLREKNEKLYGKERISIGFWVGGNVTPNKFSEYSDSDQFKKKEFIRKLTKQIIKCPYCGKEITRDEYDINEKGKYVKIHCADKNCMFSLKTGRTIPVYLVDEEIYAKCPTVIISTVDKFARLPWSERVGLLFGRTDRYCSRCGHIAIGEKHAGRHNADVAAGLERAETVACKPFYPPELIIQDELHLITGPLGTIYGGYETVVEEMCCIEKNGKKIRPKYIVSTATIRNAGEQIKFLYGRNEFAQFPPSGFDTRDSFFIKEVPLPTENLVDASEEKISRMISDGKKPFRQYAGICASGQSVKTTLIRLYSIILQTALDIAKNPEYERK